MLHKCATSLVFFSVLLEITKCADLFWLFICYSFINHCLVSPISKTQAKNTRWSQVPWPCRRCQPWAYGYEVRNIQRPRLRTGGKARCPDPAEEASLGLVVMSKWLRCQRSHLLLQFFDFQTVPSKLHLILTSLTSCSVTTVEQGFLHEQYSNQLLMSYLIKG